MVDTWTGDVPAVTAWRALGRQLAVILGAATALYSLFQDVTVLASVTRGALAWLTITLVVRAGAAAAQRIDARAREDESGGEPADEKAHETI